MGKQQAQQPEFKEITKVSLYQLAQKQPRRRLSLVRRPSGQVAAERAYNLGWDIGTDYNDNQRGWIAYAAEKMGLSYSTAWHLLSQTLLERGENTPSLSTRTVDHIAQATGVPVSAFYDPEF